MKVENSDAETNVAPPSHAETFIRPDQQPKTHSDLIERIWMNYRDSALKLEALRAQNAENPGACREIGPPDIST